MLPIPAARIAQLISAPAEDVANNWPLVEREMVALGMESNNISIAAIATIRVETWGFKPRTEKYNGDPFEYFKRYDGRFGNTQPGDGYKYRGRGYIQLTFKDNYEEEGKRIGVDLVSNPDLALDPANAAKIFANFFQDHHIDHAADAMNWKLVRRLVNGGDEGLQDFLKFVNALRYNHV